MAGEKLHVFSESSINKLKEMLKWYNQNKGGGGDNQRREPRLSGGGGSEIRMAKCIENAGATNIIHVNLYNKTTGIEIVAATGLVNGVDYNIPVYCKTSPPLEPLYTCSRRLATNNEIQVYQETFDDEGTPTKRWTAVEGFQASLDYESL